jgi:hypothetical protein
MSLKASAGLYQQPPALADLEPAPFGNQDLVYEKAFQGSFGIERKITQAINVDLTAFYNRRYDLVAQFPVSFVPRTQNGAVGRAYGLEVMLRHEVTRNFFGWVAYTLNRSEVRRRDQVTYRLTEFDQTHLLTMVGSYRLGDGWELGGRFRFATGSPRTPITHPYDIYRVDADGYSPTQGEALSSREPPFHQLDVRIDKSWVFRDWTLTAYLDVQNVYNAQNVEAYVTDYRFRTEVPVPGLPFLPILGVKGSF